jgi:spore germination protein YaaH
MLRYLFLLLNLAALPAVAAPSPQALFYLSTEAKSVQSFLAHAGQIDVVAPHWYGVDSKGVLTGEPNPQVMAAAKKHGVRVTPLVTNHGFVQEDVHQLLMHPETHPALFAALIRAARQHGYAGYQLDLEHVPSSDRDALTAFVRGAVKALHAEKLLVSIATVPNASIMKKETGYSAWHYANWGGAFDLKALGEVVDLLCLMTYDQHTFTTLPGPVAGMPWVSAQLDAAHAHRRRRAPVRQAQPERRLHRRGRCVQAGQGLQRPLRLGRAGPRRIDGLLSR